MYGITCAFQGRLGSDPELRFTVNGTALLEMSVAVDLRPRQDGDGSAQRTTQWVRVTLWDKQAEALAQEERLKKGAEVYCEGRLELRTWTDREGKERATLQCVASLVQPLGVPPQPAPAR